MKKQSKTFLWCGLLLIFGASYIIPAYSWWVNIGGVERFSDAHSPAGQNMYMISRLLGLLAVASCCWQICIGIQGKLKKPFLFQQLNQQYEIHKKLGKTSLTLFWLHSISFFAAVSLRQDKLAGKLLLPDFTDYFHTILSLGWIALVLASIAVAVRASESLRKWHKLVYIVVPLIFVHSLSFGTETRDPLMFIWYLFLGGIIIFTLSFMLLQKRRN
jgi:predicted ferric reductase